MKRVNTIVWAICAVVSLAMVWWYVAHAPAKVHMSLDDTTRIQGIWGAEEHGAWSKGDTTVNTRYFLAGTWRAISFRWRQPPASVVSAELRLETTAVSVSPPPDWRVVHVLLPYGADQLHIKSNTVQLDTDRRAIGVLLDAPVVSMMQPAWWLVLWWAIDLWLPLLCAALWLYRSAGAGLAVWLVVAVLYVLVIAQETMVGFANPTLLLDPMTRYVSCAVLLWWVLRPQPTPPTTTTQGRWFGLDVMRTIAVMLVVVAHTTPLLFHSVSADRAQYQWLLVCGYLGVDLFFALSGYLIGGILMRVLPQLNAMSVVKQFWVRRWLRTLPAAYVSALVMWVISPPRNIPDYFLSIFFMGTMNPYRISSEIPFWWSLGAEEVFYLVFPLAVHLLMKRMPPMRAFAVGLILLAGISTLNRIIAMMVLPHEVWHAIQYTIYTRLDSMIWGVVIAWMRVQRPPWFAALRGYGLGIGFMIIGLGIASFIESTRWPYVDVVVMHTLMTVGAALMIPALERVYTLGWRILDQFTSWLARISYSIYLYHIMVVLMLSRLLGSATTWLMLVVSLTAYLALTIGLAAASYYAVEAPVLRWRDKRYPHQ